MGMRYMLHMLWTKTKRYKRQVNEGSGEVKVDRIILSALYKSRNHIV